MPDTQNEGGAGAGGVATRRRQSKAARSRVTPTRRVTDVARALQEQLGQRLTAQIAGVKDPKTIGRYIAARQQPSGAVEKRLLDAHQVLVVLLAVESTYTVRSWFIGMNPLLDDDTPADALLGGRGKEVLAAARAFAEQG